MSNTQKKRSSTVDLTVTSVMAAIIVVMTFTPVGYLSLGPVEITFLTIPVAIGAILCGPVSGAILGAVFGLTSFLQCFGILRPSPFGAALLAINPISTAVICFVPRILAGLLAGLIFKAFTNKKNPLAYALPSLATGVFNTLFFVLVLITCFKTSALTGLGLGDNVTQIIAAIVTMNAVIEWAICLVVGLAVSKALDALLNAKR